MPISHDYPCHSLSVSVVLHHSDLDQLRVTLASLVAAASRAGLTPCLRVVDQSLDARYAFRAEAVVADVCEGAAVAHEFYTSEHNAGFGAGHNRAMDQFDAAVHLILNPDVRLAEDALLKAMMQFERHPELVLLAPRSVDASGQEEHIAKDRPSVLVLLLRAFAPAFLRRPFQSLLDRYEMRHLAPQGPLQPVRLVSGCCMWVRASALQAVRGFDEAYFLYFEDYDLSLRLARVGQVMRDPSIQITHYGGNAARKGWRHIRWFVVAGVRFFNRWGWKLW